MAYLHLKPSFLGESTVGLAAKEAGTYFSLNVLTPSVVTLWLSPNKTRFPMETCHRVSVGKIRLETWEEEFVLVLGHELRHIEQFWSGKTYAQVEVDAERFGLQMLNEYRASLGKPAVVPITVDRRTTSSQYRSGQAARARKTKAVKRRKTL